MAAQGWMRLMAGANSLRDHGKYSIPAYSEFMPAPRLLCKPYGEFVGTVFEEDPWGWPISEYEEAFELRPGLEHLAREILDSLLKLGRGQSAHGISRKKLENNPYWPAELANHAGALQHERYVIILPLALSRTQDDHGRVRWTLFGGSEQNPARVFWNGFFRQPDQELPEEGAWIFSDVSSQKCTGIGRTSRRSAQVRISHLAERRRPNAGLDPSVYLAREITRMPSGIC